MGVSVTAKDDQALAQVARRLFWWVSPEEALGDVDRFVAQVMALGSDSDVRIVESRLGVEAWSRVLDNPPAGLFSPRSWNYWHVRLGRSPVPALPERFSR